MPLRDNILEDIEELYATIGDALKDGDWSAAREYTETLAESLLELGEFDAEAMKQKEMN